MEMKGFALRVSCWVVRNEFCGARNLGWTDHYTTVIQTISPICEAIKIRSMIFQSQNDRNKYVLFPNHRNGRYTCRQKSNWEIFMMRDTVWNWNPLSPISGRAVPCQVNLIPDKTLTGVKAWILCQWTLYLSTFSLWYRFFLKYT